MKRSSMYACILMTLGPIPACTAQTFHGTFVHYEGAEYESTFIPCGSNDVWSISEGPIQQLLVVRAMAAERREIIVSLSLDVTPIDKAKYPQSHYTGTARVLRILDSDEAACADAIAEYTCSMSDESILHCPLVEAPLVTELGPGFVVLEFTAQPDGSVSDIRVLEEGGDNRWAIAAIDAISRWKYRESNQATQKIQRFSFEFEK